MEERTFECRDGSRWRAFTPGRSSLYRLQLVFESLDEPGRRYRGEAAADRLADLSDRELCFLIGELRAAGD
jgi:hypothetical protein